MSIIKFLDQIDTSTFDKEGKERFLSRKDALGKLTNFSKNLALSAVPLGAIAAFSSPAIAQSGDRSVTDVLNFALTLEYLEADFYNMGNAADGLIPSEAQTVYNQIAKHENQHVAFLEDLLGDDANPKPTFDFTVNGTFDPFNNYGQFLALSQAFEDTGVRAYKGQAGFLQSNGDTLTAALSIHSVEARHASEVRRLRGDFIGENVKGWITQDQRGPGMPSATQASYDNEGMTTQLGVDVPSITDVGADGVTEAWDEPLGTQAVLDIANLFIES